MVTITVTYHDADPEDAPSLAEEIASLVALGNPKTHDRNARSIATTDQNEGGSVTVTY